MNRPLLAVVTFCVLAGSAAFAQQPAVDAPASSGPGAAHAPRWSRNRTAQSAAPDNVAEPANPELQPAALLERAYSISRDLPLEARASLLSWALDPASRIEPKLAASWADELFQISQDLSNSDQQARAEVAAVRALARIDVDHALAVFRGMDALTLQSGHVVPQDARAAAAEALFPEILRKKGAVSISLLQQEGQRLAESGAYPYAAIAFAADPLLHTDRSLVERIFSESLAFYQQSTPTLAGNADFVTMLKYWGLQAPRDQAQQAITAVVNNLLTQADDSGQKLAQPFQFQGSTLDNSADYLLLQLLPVLRVVQPELMNRIVQSRPALGQAAGGMSAWPRGSWSFAPMGESASAANSDQAVVNRIQRAASSDPQAALAVSNQLQDPAVRSQALAAVASGMASKDPQQAAQLLSNAQDLAAKIDDKRKQLQAIAAMAQAANRMNNQAVLRDSLARGFALGNELLQLDENNGTSPSFSLLSPLVRAGAHTQLETLVAGIQGIQNLQVKAQLLVLTAQSMPRRPARAQTAPAPEPEASAPQKSASAAHSQ